VYQSLLTAKQTR